MQNRKNSANLNYFGTKTFLRRCLPTLDVFVQKQESYRRLNFRSELHKVNGKVRGDPKNATVKIQADINH